MMSVDSSLFESEQEHGRTYHSYKTGSQSRRAIDFPTPSADLSIQNMCYPMTRSVSDSKTTMISS